jgi:hypothetical protein
VGWLEKTKVWLGILDPEEAENLEEDAPRAARKPRQEGERPPLDGIEAPPQQSLDDALAARERGDLEEMRRLLCEMDRGHGLRLVLRAAAALEARDESELATLLPRVREEEPRWRLPLQIAAALDDRARAAHLAGHAAAAGAPRWAVAWSRALSPDAEEQRRGLVALLFADPALARTVAARDLKISGAVADSEAAQRYAAFAHGLDCIRRFGAAAVADLYDRAMGSK